MPRRALMAPLLPLLDDDTRFVMLDDAAASCMSADDFTPRAFDAPPRRYL